MTYLASRPILIGYPYIQTYNIYNSWIVFPED